MLGEYKLKVAWLHPHFKQWNGGVRYIYEVAKRLNDKCEIKLYVGMASPPIRNMFSEIGIEIKEIPSLFFSTDYNKTNVKHWLFFNYYLRRACKDLKGEFHDYDVLFSSYFPMNCITSRLTKKSIYMFFEPCTFLYDDYFISDFSFMKRNLIKSLRQFYFKYDIEGAKKSSKLITITKFSAYRGKQIYNRLAEVSYPGVDSEFFCKKYDDRLMSQYSGYKIVLHSASYFNPVKGTHFLIMALPKILKKVTKCKLLILNCVKDAKTKSKLINLANKLGVLDKIEFLPFIDEKTLPYYYSLADVVAQPSIHESFRLPLCEGNACETPGVCFSGGSAEEEIIHGQTGFIAPLGRVEELASAITTILENPDLKERLGKASRKRVESLFNWDRTADCVWKIIKDTS